MARKRYKTKRMDYRKGGRVQYAVGGRGPKEIKGNRSKPKRGNYDSKDEYQIALQQYRDSKPTTTAPAVTPPARAGAPVTRPAGKAASTVDAITKEVEARKSGTSSASATRPSPSIVSEEPDLSSGRTDGQIAQSESPRGAPLRGPGSTNTPGTNIEAVAKSTAEKVPPLKRPTTDVLDRGKTKTATEEVIASTKIPDASLTDPSIQGTIASQQERPKVETTQVTPVTVAQAQQGIATDAQAPQPITTATMEAAQAVPEQQAVAAEGVIDEDAIAKAAKVERIPTIEGADVTIPEGALTARVTGVISPQATAQAAQAAGTTLSRVTRAKKQLRNAGISEQAITALGNDPEDLEDRLMDLTEKERGVIGDLPEEALVSNQLDSLLKGMENGEIPTWAGPAVSAVEQMLAQRGLSASTVGRDNLFNAIIQSAVPLAQSNAQAIQASVAQSRDIEAREELANAQMRQQTALQNAGNVFQMDMAQFSADQQTALSNSKFLQTVGLTEASNNQQAAIQNAVIATQVNMQNATLLQQARSQNAKSFLAMDMANLSNKQQAAVVTAQFQNQVLLSDQAASNAAKQFNSASENQTNQFMASLAQQVELSNADRADRMTISNNAAINARAAAQAGIEADLAKTNAALETDINKTNAELEYRRDAFNATNSAAVKASNVAWRRNANTINTAAANTIAMQNTMNAFNLGTAELAYLWQEARDNASFAFQGAEREEDRKNAIRAQVLVNDANAAINSANNQNTNRRDFYGRYLSEIWK